MDYQKQAQHFLDKTGTTITIEYIGKQKHFDDDKEERDCYCFTIRRGTRLYSARFGDSIANTEKRESLAEHKKRKNELSKIQYLYETRKEYKEIRAAVEKLGKEYEEPMAYDILSCMTKYDPGTFQDFCIEYGYDNDSIRAKKTYEAVRDEYLNVAKIFTDEEMEEMAEIQ